MVELGFDPGTFGTEGGYLASELLRQMGGRPLSLLEDLVETEVSRDVIGSTLKMSR